MKKTAIGLLQLLFFIPLVCLAILSLTELGSRDNLDRQIDSQIRALESELSRSIQQTTRFQIPKLGDWDDLPSIGASAENSVSLIDRSIAELSRRRSQEVEQSKSVSSVRIEGYQSEVRSLEVALEAEVRKFGRLRDRVTAMLDNLGVDNPKSSDTIAKLPNCRPGFIFSRECNAGVRAAEELTRFAKGGRGLN